jgi:hypothetical protein
MSVDVRCGAWQDSRSLLFATDGLLTLRLPMIVSPSADPIEILFRLHNASSPRQAGLSDDARLLGIGLHEMTLRRRGAALGLRGNKRFV